MLATFKETIHSFRDLRHGDNIVKNSVGHELWYWTKYLLTLAILGLVVALAVLTYFTPQLFKIASQTLPDITITVKEGKASANVPQPFVRGDENFSFIIDTKGDGQELDKYKSGMLLTADKLITKSTNETRITELKEVEDFTASKAMVVDWLKTHQATILIAGIVLALLIFVLMGGMYYAWNMLWFLIWSLLLLIVGKIFKKKLVFTNAFKLVVHASVFAFFVQFIATLLSVRNADMVALLVVLFYSISWTYNLGGVKK